MGKGKSQAPVSPAQCRAARAVLGWSQDRLAELAGVSRTMVTDFEKGARVPLPATHRALQSALEAAGIEFVFPSTGRAGLFFDEPQ